MIYVVGGFFLAVGILLGTASHYHSRKEIKQEMVSPKQEIVSPIERTVKSEEEIIPIIRIHNDNLDISFFRERLPLLDTDYIPLQDDQSILPNPDKQALDELIKKYESELKLLEGSRSPK